MTKTFKRYRTIAILKIEKLCSFYTYNRFFSIFQLHVHAYDLTEWYIFIPYLNLNKTLNLQVIFPLVILKFHLRSRCYKSGFENKFQN